MQAFHELRKYKDNFMVWYGIYPNMSFLPHWHSETEIMHIKSGKIIIHIDGKAYSASSGDIIICPGGAIHSGEKADAKNCVEFIVFDNKIMRSDLLLNCMPAIHLSSAQIAFNSLQNFIASFFGNITEELNRRDMYYKEIIRNILERFFLILRRTYFDEFENFNEEGIIVQKRKEIHKLLDYIEENYSEKITLKDAADYISFSECYVSRLFCKYTGMGFIDYLNSVRTEKAIIKLKENNSRISDIAFSCGFGSIRNFNRIFKQITGKNPKEFINKNEIFELFLEPRKYSISAIIDNDSSVVICES